jgi:transcriptional regulator with XRE-family HTH domain
MGDSQNYRRSASARHNTFFAQTMKSNKKPLPQAPLAELIAGKMGEIGVSINDLAGALEISYEHARRVVRGECLPSKHLLASVCEALEIDLGQAERIASLYQMHAKYGNLVAESAGKNSELEPIERVWDLLTPEQQQDAIAMIQAWASRNKTATGLPDATPLPPESKKAIEANFNRIKEWLDPKLKRMDLSPEEFARTCHLSKASIYFYRVDATRPDVQSMTKMCEVIGVPLEEGLAQYTPRRNGRMKST